MFFHRPVGSDEASIDVYLDETSLGLSGNWALVVDLVDLGERGDATRVLRRLAAASMAALPEHERRPVILRFRLPGAGAETGRAEKQRSGSRYASPDALSRPDLLRCPSSPKALPVRSTPCWEEPDLQALVSLGNGFST
ncbi:MAG: hypothetical protein OSA81_10035 [Longimicrobiales bacterium]|nr:hypothetical protein [Longimicrobiales bacterium]